MDSHVKKVLIAVNFVGFVGFLWDDLEYFKKNGYDIYLTADYEEGYKQSTIERLNSYGVKFIHIPTDAKSPLTKKNWQGLRKLKKVIDTENFDLIVCHTAITGIHIRLAAMSSRRKGTKVVYMTHGLSYNHTSSWRAKMVFGMAERFCSLLCDGIITINEEDYEEVRNMHCKNVWKIDGVGLDLSRYTDVPIDRTEYRKMLNLDVSKVVLVTAGELSVRKNHQTIIRAISKLPNKDQYIFAICGRVQTKDGETPDVVSLADNLGVEVRLLGYRDDLEKVFACCDIGVMPSLREGLGMAGIQMLCAGLPIVGSAVQGIKEYCIDGRTGYLVENPLDAEAFAQAIEKLSDKATREAMKSECIAITKKFSTEHSVAQRKCIYDFILNL